MSNRFNYILATTLILGLILADLYNIASLAFNAVILSLAALLLISIGVRDNANLPAWVQQRKTKPSSTRGNFRTMVMRVEGAAGGYSYSREELANLLAEAFAVRSGESLRPDYDMRMGARESLKAKARGDPATREIFDDHPSGYPKRLRFRRAKDYGYYLSGLESAIRMIREGE